MPLVNAAGPPLVDVLDDLVSRFVLNCPEEEKTSFERFFFQIEAAFWFYDDHYREQFPEQYPTMTLRLFAEKLFKHCEVLKPYKAQSAELFAKFTD
jgi:mRNA-decapping enzyme subunit 2